MTNMSYRVKCIVSTVVRSGWHASEPGVGDGKMMQWMYMAKGRLESQLYRNINARDHGLEDKVHSLTGAKGNWEICATVAICSGMEDVHVVVNKNKRWRDEEGGRSTEPKGENTGNAPRHGHHQHSRCSRVPDQLENSQSNREIGSPAMLESLCRCETLPEVNVRENRHGTNASRLTLTKSSIPAQRLKFGHWRQPRWCMTVR